MPRANQPPAPGEKVRAAQWWPLALRLAIAARAAQENRSVASMTVILAERGLKKSEPKA